MALRLERAIAVLLMAIGALLIVERLLPVDLPPLVPAEPGLQLTAGLALGLAIGTASTFLGVAGGGAADPDPGSCSAPTSASRGAPPCSCPSRPVCVGLYRYNRMGLFPNRRTLLRIGLPMGAESFVGAAAGGTLAGTTSAAALKLLLGLVLIAAALKAFWKPL